jgi:hypothetical protein
VSAIYEQADQDGDTLLVTGAKGEHRVMVTTYNDAQGVNPWAWADARTLRDALSTHLDEIPATIDEPLADWERELLMATEEPTPWEPDLHESSDPVETAVYQALGAASVCWESMSGTGIFNDRQARAIGEGLMDIIRGAQDAAEHEGYSRGRDDEQREAHDQGYREGVEEGRAEAFAEFEPMAHAHAVEVLRVVVEATS